MHRTVHPFIKPLICIAPFGTVRGPTSSVEIWRENYCYALIDISFGLVGRCAIWPRFHRARYVNQNHMWSAVEQPASDWLPFDDIWLRFGWRVSHPKWARRDKISSPHLTNSALQPVWCASEYNQRAVFSSPSRLDQVRYHRCKMVIKANWLMSC